MIETNGIKTKVGPGSTASLTFEVFIIVGLAAPRGFHLGKEPCIRADMPLRETFS